jgi:hypothetical protein
MAGNYPVAVRKVDGELFIWTMLDPLEEFTEEVRQAREVSTRANSRPRCSTGLHTSSYNITKAAWLDAITPDEGHVLGSDW